MRLIGTRSEPRIYWGLGYHFERALGDVSSSRVGLKLKYPKFGLVRHHLTVHELTLTKKAFAVHKTTLTKPLVTTLGG